MRTRRLPLPGFAVTLALAAGLAVFAGSSGVAAADSNGPLVTPAPKQSATDLATEVCEDMVRDAVISASGGPLAAPQTGAWKGKRYTCTYPLTGGQLTVRVDTYPTKKKAKTAYAKLAKATKIDQKLAGLGQQALLAKNGQVVAFKDHFVLVADPAQLPPKLSKANVSLAAVEAVLSCWVGTGGV